MLTTVLKCLYLHCVEQEKSPTQQIVHQIVRLQSGSQQMQGVQQSGQIAESGSQTRLPDAAVLPTMLYGWYVLNLNLKLDFNPNLTITVGFFELQTTS